MARVTTEDDLEVQFATAQDGTRIAFKLAGEGSPLVLLPGQSNDHRWWLRTLDLYAERHTCILIDPRGTGDSGAPEGPYSTRQMAGDVLAVLDELGIERTHFYGASMGGRVAQWFAADHPDRLCALVIGCTSPGHAHGVERDLGVRALMSDPDREQRKKNVLNLMYSPEWLAANPGPYAVLGSRGMAPHAVRAHLQASDTHDAWDALPLIKAPTLVLHGQLDRMTPADNVELFTSRIPNAVGHIFPYARHAYFDECAVESAELVLDHLDAHECSPFR